jgi:hypothetical protein
MLAVSSLPTSFPSLSTYKRVFLCTHLPLDIPCVSICSSQHINIPTSEGTSMSRPNISYPQPIHPNNTGPSTYPSPHQVTNGSFATGSGHGAPTAGRRTSVQSVQSVNSVGFRQPSGPRPGVSGCRCSVAARECWARRRRVHLQIVGAASSGL